MASLFNLEDIVMWENKIYIIKSIVYIDCYVYGLVPIDNPESIVKIMVNENLLVGYGN